MRLLHWNTHHGGLGTDGKLNTARLGQAMARLTPDIVTLNEIEQFDGYGNQDTVGLLCGILGPEWFGHWVNTSGVITGRGQGNAVLTKRIHAGARGKGLAHGRSAALLVVAGIPIVAAHLSSTSAVDRAVQACQLLSWDGVRGITTMILAGDWNAPVTSVELAPCAHWYADAWGVAKTLGTATSFTANGATRGTNRIDLVFTRGVTVRSVDVPDTRIDGIFPSDHNPVVVEF